MCPRRPRRRWNERSTCDWIFARSTRRHRSIEAPARSRSGVRSSGRVRARGDARVPRTTRRAGSTARRVTAREVTARGNPRRASDAHGEERGDGERRARGKSSKSNPPGWRIGVAFGRDVEEATTGRRRVRARRAEEEEGAEGAHAGGGRGAQGASLRAGGSARRDRSLAPRLAPTRARVVFKTTRFNSIHHDRSSPPHRSSPA